MVDSQDAFTDNIVKSINRWCPSFLIVWHTLVAQEHTHTQQVLQPYSVVIEVMPDHGMVLINVHLHLQT